jgi:DNA-directed RNA polymerase specialized sigma24 family protein
LSKTSPNPGPRDINQEQFDELLSWLDPDREVAGAKYESIHKRLIKIFVSRGSSISEELADRTMNRVAQKLPEIRVTYVGEPAHYFYSVANYIWYEAIRQAKLPVVAPPKILPPDEDAERDFACLERCLAKLPDSERNLVVAYYQEEKHAKIDNRKKLAEQLNLGMNALRIRACRIRAALFQCVEQCRREDSQSPKQK